MGFLLCLLHCACVRVKSLWSGLTLLQPYGLHPSWLPCPWGFSRREYWTGLPRPPPPGDLPAPGIEPASLTSPALAGRFFTTSTIWEAHLPQKWSPTFLAPGAGFMKDNFSTDRGQLSGGWFEGESSILHFFISTVITSSLGFPGGSDGKESACNVGDLGSIPESGRSPGGGHGNPLQCSCLENPHGQRSLVGYSRRRSQSQT